MFDTSRLTDLHQIWIKTVSPSRILLQEIKSPIHEIRPKILPKIFTPIFRGAAHFFWIYLCFWGGQCYLWKPMFSVVTNFVLWSIYFRKSLWSLKAESLKTRYQNVRQINTVFLDLKTIKLYSKLWRLNIYYSKTYHYYIIIFLKNDQIIAKRLIYGWN